MWPEEAVIKVGQMVATGDGGNGQLSKEPFGENANSPAGQGQSPIGPMGQCGHRANESVWPRWANASIRVATTQRRQKGEAVGLKGGLVSQKWRRVGKGPEGHKHSRTKPAGIQKGKGASGPVCK